MILASLLGQYILAVHNLKREIGKEAVWCSKTIGITNSCLEVKLVFCITDLLWLFVPCKERSRVHMYLPGLWQKDFVFLHPLHTEYSSSL